MAISYNWCVEVRQAMAYDTYNSSPQSWQDYARLQRDLYQAYTECADAVIDTALEPYLGPIRRGIEEISDSISDGISKQIDEWMS